MQEFIAKKFWEGVVRFLRDRLDIINPGRPELLIGLSYNDLKV